MNKNHEFLFDREGAVYPPHHTGDHLEEAFVKFWEAEGKGDRKLIPVHWTAVYNHRIKEGLGPNTPNGDLRNRLKKYLQSLDPSGKYFVVCTHDDAPSEELPPDTLVFAAGGNARKIDVPIPLTCGPHKDIGDYIRTVPMSFIGSLTHSIRYEMGRALHSKSGIFLNISEWTPEISNEKVDLFKNVTQRSIFSLCPRGYGTTSYRLYEAMQLGAVPVYISDKHLLPWSDEINWNQFSIIMLPSDIPNILNLTLGMSGSKLKKMQDALEHTWQKHFSIEATCRHIEKRLKK